MVRAHVESKDPIWVGQKVTVVVELFAPGYFSSAATFDLPDPEGVLLVPPLGHPIISSQTIDKSSYTVQRHELAAYPMRAGKQTIPAVNVRFDFKHAPQDATGIAATVTTTPMPLSVALPPGAEHLGQIISARDLKVEEAWQPEPGKGGVQAGSAFTRTITFSAADMPGMVFPPFPAGQIDGLSIYTKQQLLDQTENGSLRGERRDTITYVCQRPGEFTIPSARFTWFDLDTNQLRTTDLAERTLTVAAPPQGSTTNAADAKGPIAVLRLIPWWMLTGLVLAVALLLLVIANARFRRIVSEVAFPLRAVHLQALNPANGCHNRHNR